jgi:hypothetical protein
MNTMKEKPTTGLVKELGQGSDVDGSASRGGPEQLADPDGPKSRYSIEECRRFAEWGFRNGSVSNPVNYARAIHRSGSVDSSIERLLWEEKLRLDGERELAVIEARHQREVEDLEKAVGQAMRAWAAERAARVRESAYGGAVFLLSVVMMCGAVWVGLGPWVVERWRRSQAEHLSGSAAGRGGGQGRQPAATPARTPGGNVRDAGGAQGGKR